ncbi:MAG: hypothetical protein G3M70_10945 [Candidatus Nitronauta litoralis]|uniref:Uncharacterized protein n=1 Tax=Candidatus Nitronauta litoralis TaxID=2705533 RepID=A0A7T0G0J3_9BACT|nr:MAG: hypothetical protein G3M70_10945 [Candidatus Nitronauta litoralis]
MKNYSAKNDFKFGWVSLLVTGAMVLGSGAVNLAFANPHTTILKKNTPSKYAVREELEGTSSVINHVRIPHGCNGTDIRAMSLVFPNGNTTAVATDNNESVDLVDHIEGSPVSDIGAVQDKNIFRHIAEVEANGPFGENVRAIHYTNGKLDAHHVGLVPWNSNFPKFKEGSCATSLKVNIAIANYCTRSRTAENRADIWIGHLTELFNDPAVVSQSPPNFWPHLIVVRDQENNPLAPECGEGFGIEVSPSDEDIDAYLPIRRYWPFPQSNGGADE